MNSSSGGKDGSADETPDFRPGSAMGQRAYAPPVLLRLGSLQDLTRSVGNQGANDGGRTGRNKKTGL